MIVCDYCWMGFGSSHCTHCGFNDMQELSMDTDLNKAVDLMVENNKKCLVRGLPMTTLEDYNWKVVAK